ncbi:MAG: glutamate-5-semialdehyde dehydrogenase [Burkholderia sp.]|nr:glutamate-5-semialdehyde dehydrogenase [Burkholderia sp.]
MDIDQYMTDLCRSARAGSRSIARASAAKKSAVLNAIAFAIARDIDILKSANSRDIARARDKRLSPAFIDRLTLSDDVLKTIIESLRQLALMDDPIGEITNLKYRTSGIQVGQMRVPIGVIGIIYESRPNVTIDAAALCLKSGNATILRGGSEALESNMVLAKLIGEGLTSVGLPQNIVQVVSIADRAAVGKMITMKEYIDVIIPRGGKSLIKRLIAEARIPMIKHLDGVCHVYVDDHADIKKSINVCNNSKTHGYSACNAMETLLVARGISHKLLPLLCRIYQNEGVELRVDQEAREMLNTFGIGPLVEATELDWQTEYMSLVLAIKIVDNITDAIEHINTFGSHHTDSIVTDNHDRAMRFLREVDSATVMINASTRFADGFEFGLGAEIGISNDKLHARGPVGLEGLTSMKYIVFGHGEGRQ